MMTDTIEQYLPLAKWMFDGNFRNSVETIVVSSDNIECKIEIHFMCVDVLDFTIRTPKRGIFLNSFGSYSFCRKIETIEQMAGSLQYLFQRFHAMKFNHCIGIFESISEIEKRTAIELSSGDLHRKPNECCVCKMMTIRKTHCDHTLCVFCHDKLKGKNCPMCRASVDEDEDED